MDIFEIRKNVADNLAAKRTAAGMTQAQLAEKLNYTDKAISKWERAESVPDISILKQIADMFGVSVDWLITEHTNEEEHEDHEREVQKLKQHNELQISLLSVVAVWFVAVVAFVVMFAIHAKNPWIPFLWAVPATAIDLLVFNAVWGQYKRNFLFISIIIWGILGALYITLGVTLGDWSLWYIFLFGIPLQIATVFWSQIRVAITPKKEKGKGKNSESKPDKKAGKERKPEAAAGETDGTHE